MAKYGQVHQSSEQSYKVPDESVLILGGIQISRQNSVGHCMPKTSSFHPVVSIQYQPVMDGWTHDDSIYSYVWYSTAMCGKNKKCINITGWSRKVNTFSLITAMQPSIFFKYFTKMFWRFLRIETTLQFLTVPIQWLQPMNMLCKLSPSYNTCKNCHLRQSQLMLFLPLFSEMWKAFILSLLLSKTICA